MLKGVEVQENADNVNVFPGEKAEVVVHVLIATNDNIWSIYEEL